MKNIFENKTRLNDDECDIESREHQNVDICQYRMFNIYQTNKDNEKECKTNYDKIMDFSVNNRMNIRDGMGFTNACRVDDDSQVRNEFEMYDKGRQQLFSRVFQGGPNVNKGGLEPEIDSKVTQGLFTTRKETCEVLSEKSFERFEPMKECMLKNIQNPKNIVPTWVRGGEGTRDVLSQKDFLENNGYMFDGNVWQKKCM